MTKTDGAGRSKRTWLGIGALVALAAGFGLLADEVAEGDTAAFDHYVLMALRNPADPTRPLGPAWLPETLRDITALGSVSVLTILVVIVVLYLLAKRHIRTALFIVASVVIGTVLSSTLKLIFNRARPDLPGLPEVFTASFPSGHAALSAVVYLSLGMLLAETESDHRVRALLIAIAVLLTLLVGLSRVVIGVHYPTDVAAGWCLGLAWSLACRLALDRWRRAALA